MKYEVIAKAPFYCIVLQRVFVIGEIVDIKNQDRADILASVGLLKPIVEKKKVTSRKKVKDNA